MKFRRAMQRYGRTPEPETPFQRAGQLWDERIGSARVQAQNWRIAALGALALAGALAGGLLWQSLQSRVVPYVVEVDRLGEAKAVAPADAGYRPTDPQVAWHLGRLIRNVRSVSLDPVLMRENWLAAYDFVTGPGEQFISEHARSSDPFGQAGNRTVSVEVTSVVRASDRSFQVKWTETVYERGNFAGRSRWTAILSVRLKAPQSPDVLRRNPLGLYVDEIDWSRELEPEPQERPAPPDNEADPNVPAGSPLGPGRAPAGPADPDIAGERP